MTKHVIIPAGYERKYETMQFAPAIRVGNTVWVSGQAGINPDGSIPDSIEEQMHLAYKSLKVVLEAAGASLADVVELVSYHVMMPNDTKEAFAVKKDYFPSDFPAWTAVGVSALALPGLLFEVKATAVVGEGKAA